MTIFNYFKFFLKLFRKFYLLLKLEKYLAGIKKMQKLPNIVIIIGQKKELNAVRECLKLGITIITILDTNCDPTLTDYLIPANDDSISSIDLILKCLVNAIIAS
jgi:small subunit ribosomal protein S2